MKLGAQFQRKFFDEIRQLESVLNLFDYVPQVFFFAKDVKSRFVKVNKANLSIYGLTEESEILGKTDADFHPPALAEAYISEDRRVMKCGKPIENQAGWCRF